MNVVRVISYNVLSGHLSGSKHYPECQPENLDQEVRYKKIKKLLRNLILGFTYRGDQATAERSRPIICLQELGLDWVGRLTIYFQHYSYQLLHTNYGNHFNDYMGVAIAVPMEYQMHLIKYIAPVNEFTSGDGIDWDQVMRRYNRYILVELTLKGTDLRFALVCIHMPCLWKYPKAMTTYNLLVLKSIERNTSCSRLILTGDFNQTPDSDGFKMITGQKCSYKIPKKGAPTGLDTNLKLVYKSVSDSQDKYPPTVHTRTSDRTSIFSEAIDHMFYTGDITCGYLETTPVLQSVIPDVDNPSDHIPVATSFVLTNKSKTHGQDPNY